MSSEIVLLTRRPRPRWHRAVTIAFVLATVLGGMVEAVAPALATTGSISGVVFHDEDRDGVRDPGEGTMPSATLVLKDASGRSLAATSTDSEGSYQFTGLSAGSYKVAYSSSSWWALWEDWVPTTTGSLRPSMDVDVSGVAVADMGWRLIVRSTDSSQPLSELVGPSGVTVQSFNDAVSADEVHTALASGSLIGAEAPNTTIRFGLGGGNFCGTSGNEGSTAFSATCTIDYIGWVQHGDASMFHEYGHAWARYHAYAVQADAELTGYLEARGLLGDARLDTSHAWARGELIAEDYRQLFGSTNAASAPQENGDIPPAAEVDGLAEYLRTTFMTGATADNGDPVDSQPPVLEALTPTSGTVVSGEATLAVHAADDGTPDDALAVSFVLAGQMVDASHDPTSDAWVAAVDSSLVEDGVQVLRATATDEAGNTSEVANEVVVDNDVSTAPVSPSNFEATDLGDGTARLAWQDVDGETAYTLLREQIHHRSGKVIGTTSLELDADTALLVDPSGEGSFRYTLTARNEVGTSAPVSATVTVTATQDDASSGTGKCHPKWGC